MTQQPELLAVTQKDREAAASYWRQSRIGSEETYRSYLIGERDNSFIVQAFARHRLQSTAAAFCVSSTDINTVCEQPEGVSVTTTAPEGGPDAAIVTGGQYDRDDFGPIGEAARRICSYTEGEARRNVYKVAKTELTALRAERDALREALKSAAENLSWAARMMKGNCRGSDVDAVNLAAGHATEARAALDRKESGNG